MYSYILACSKCAFTHIQKVSRSQELVWPNIEGLKLNNLKESKHIPATDKAKVTTTNIAADTSIVKSKMTTVQQ